MHGTLDEPHEPVIVNHEDDDGVSSPQRPRFDPWSDIDGTPIPQPCRIEQVEVDKSLGALPSRLHRQGQVLGRGSTRLIVQFDNEDTVVSIRPHLVRVLTTPDGH